MLSKGEVNVRINLELKVKRRSGCLATYRVIGDGLSTSVLLPSSTHTRLCETRRVWERVLSLTLRSRTGRGVSRLGANLRFRGFQAYQ